MKLLKVAGGLVLLLAAAFLVLTLLARGDGLPPRAIAAEGAALAASPAGPAPTITTS